MADITITSPCIPNSLANCETLLAAVAIASGKLVYRNTSGLAALADSDSTAATAECIGMAVNTAGIGEPVTVAKNGATVTQTGTTFTKGTVYFVSNTAGGICPQADIATGDYSTSIGIATSTSAIALNIQISGITVT